MHSNHASDYAFVVASAVSGEMQAVQSKAPKELARAFGANSRGPNNASLASNLELQRAMAAAALVLGGVASSSHKRRSKRYAPLMFASEPSSVTTAVQELEDAEEEEESIADFVARYKQQPDAVKSAPEPVVSGPIAVPFMGAPRYREFLGEVEGDAGFDPMVFCKDVDGFTFMREAELKHCRLAMLAAVGWPMSELFQPVLAEQFMRNNDLARNGMAPSVLNGGLDKDVVPVFLVAALISGFVVDLSKQMNPRGVGSHGFDPLGLQDVRPPVIGEWVSSGRNWMLEAELKNGRIAMLAITSFAMQEFLTKVPVVKETPFFFGRF